MSIKIMIVDNDPFVRECISNDLGTIFDLNVIGEGGAGEGTMNLIKQVNPEIVLMNVLPAEYETVKICLQLLVEDSSVRFLTISRCEKRLMVLAVFNMPSTCEKDFHLLIERLTAAGSGILGGALGTYTLKDVSLRCA